MKKAVLAMLAGLGIGMAMNAAALEDYVGVTLDAVRSSVNGVSDTSAGFTGMISARPNRYYGYEVQGGVFGRIGAYSANGEADFAIAGFLPLAGSGINLYGKAGVDSVYSSGNVFNTGLTYGAGVEYQSGKGVLRLGYQHFNAGQSPSFGARLVGISFLVRLDK